MIVLFVAKRLKEVIQKVVSILVFVKNVMINNISRKEIEKCGIKTENVNRR